jgi:hypothetical protein
MFGAGPLGAHQCEHCERRADLLLGFCSRPAHCSASGIQVPAASVRTDSGYPGGMLAFILKKFVESYLALRAVSRVHWPSVYACRTRSAASSLVKFT